MQIGVRVDQETDRTLAGWKVTEGRSKRRHVGILLKKLCQVKAIPERELLRLPNEDILRRLEIIQ